MHCFAAPDNGPGRRLSLGETSHENCCDSLNCGEAPCRWPFKIDGAEAGVIEHHFNPANAFNGTTIDDPPKFSRPRRTGRRGAGPAPAWWPLLEAWGRAKSHGARC